jgi:secretion/DNA translocation related TadE-like protein
LGLIGVVAISMAAVLWLGGAVLAKARAQTAADMAALAGAQALLDHLGEIAACEQASAVARAHGAQMTACATNRERCEITVAFAATKRTNSQGGVTAWARAVAGRPP